jgi:hypothetical protein
VKATSVANTKKSASATVKVTLPPPAIGAVYTDPTGTGWRIVKDAAASSANKVVLKLVGPAGLNARGVALTLQHGGNATKVSWVKNADGKYATNNSPFELWNTVNTEPQAFLAGVDGSSLMVGAFQKGKTKTAKAVNVDLFTFQIEVKAGLLTGTQIPLTVTKAEIYPETVTTFYLQPITVAVGSLVAQ